MSIEQLLLINSGFLTIILIALLFVGALSTPRSKSPKRVSRDINKIKEQINE